jgi:hypothetical protein
METRCDVLVVGAGVAGVPAAVAAARQGAATLLVEQNAFPGGAGVTALHRYICGTHLRVTDSPEIPLNPGICADILADLHQRSPESRPMPIGRVHVIPYDTEVYQAVYSALLASVPNLQTLYNTRVLALELAGQRIQKISVQTGSTSLEIRPQCVVDCSGSGLIIRLAKAGQPETPAADRPLAGFSIRLLGVADPAGDLCIRVPLAMREASEAGQFPHCLRFTTFTPGRTPAEGYIKFSLPPDAPESDPDPARRLVLDAHRFLADHIAGLKDSVITALSSGVHERESTRLSGRHVLSAEEVLTARTFEDTVASGAWPIEHWHPRQGPRFQYLRPGASYQIPGRCLASKAIDGLFAAGRCISVTSEALGSTRVMGPCMALGAAAGFLAASRAIR